MSEVYGLSWSGDGRFIAVCTQADVALVFNTENGKLVSKLDGHSLCVQGVAWDPLGEFLATESSDRTAHVWKKVKGRGGFGMAKFRVLSSLKKSESGGAEQPDAPKKDILKEEGKKKKIKNDISECEAEMEQYGVQDETKKEKARKSFKLFISEASVMTFVRRPDWSPDGSLLVVPTAQFDPSFYSDNGGVNSHPVPVSVVYHREWLSSPVAILPHGKSVSVAVRFFQKPVTTLKRFKTTITSDTNEKSSNAEDDGVNKGSSRSPTSWLFPVGSDRAHKCKERWRKVVDNEHAPLIESKKGYIDEREGMRFLFCVLTQQAVFLYDTQHTFPIGIVKDIHCKTLTDASWSPDGRMLAVSSADGYVTFILIDPGEFGHIDVEAAAQLIVGNV
eukprot:GHVL01038596.1.p1 GENE.GHVL01038596.1~~GHVL01038596.1.p1  ORF type:complete len:390 (-),score=51.40 GHVL01038596.1:1171-2340(-)